jgi:hypothetical protein
MKSVWFVRFVTFVRDAGLATCHIQSATNHVSFVTKDILFEHGIPATTVVCVGTQKDHREDARGRKREKPSPFIYNDIDNFAILMFRAFAIDSWFSDGLT